MEFPYGHNTHTHHHHHQRNDDDDQEEERPQHYPPPATGPPPPFNRPPPQGPPPPYYQENEFAPPPPRPPPPYYQEYEFQPPPPQVSHGYHHTTQNQQELDYPPPPPPPTQVTHVYHQVEQETIEQTETHHSFKPHLPSFLQHHSHEASSGSGLDLSKKPTYKVYCKAAPNFHLTIKDGKIVLAPSDPSDEYQNWYKDEKFSTNVKDEVGFPSFALVNKASCQAVKHSIGASHPVQLIPYNPDVLDESVLWSESKDTGEGYRAVRMVNNIRLNLDAFNGDKKSGGVHTGTTIVLWQWNKGDNQRWKITPHCKFLKKGHEISTKILAVF